MPLRTEAELIPSLFSLEITVERDLYVLYGQISSLTVHEE